MRKPPQPCVAGPYCVSLYEKTPDPSADTVDTVAYMMEPLSPGAIVHPDEWVDRSRVVNVPEYGFYQERTVLMGRVNPDLTAGRTVFVAAMMEASQKIHAAMAALLCKHEPIIRGPMDVVSGGHLHPSMKEFLAEPDQYLQELQSPIMTRMSSEVDFTTEMVRSNTLTPPPDDLIAVDVMDVMGLQE